MFFQGITRLQVNTEVVRDKREPFRPAASIACTATPLRGIFRGLAETADMCPITRRHHFPWALFRPVRGLRLQRPSASLGIDTLAARRIPPLSDHPFTAVCTGTAPATAPFVMSGRNKIGRQNHLPPFPRVRTGKSGSHSEVPGPVDWFYFVFVAPKPPATMPLLKSALNSPATESGATLGVEVSSGSLWGVTP